MSRLIVCYAHPGHKYSHANCEMAAVASATDAVTYVDIYSDYPRFDIDADGVTLIITGGLRTPADFAKAMALGADGVAVSNAALQAIGCLGMRACHTNNCPVGIATQKERLRERLPVDIAAEREAFSGQ